MNKELTTSSDIPEHEKWIHNTISDEQYAEEYKTAVQIMPNGAVIKHPDSYEKQYDKVAFHTMSKDDASIAHLCVALKCSRPTIARWLLRHPTFKQMFQAGKEISEKKFRKKITDNAFDSSNKVNNGLIKMIAINVHGMEVDTPQVIVNNNNSNQTIVGSDKLETSNLYQDAIEITPDQD